MTAKPPKRSRAGMRVISALQYDVYRAGCPTRRVLDLIADKWTTLIVGLLAERPHLFGELRGAIEGISNKVLAENLRSLEADGLVVREVQPTRRITVRYSLTPLGLTLTEPLAAIRKWAEQHVGEIQAANDAWSRTSESAGSRVLAASEPRWRRRV